MEKIPQEREKQPADFERELKEFEQAISSAEDFDELYAAIDKAEVVEEFEKTYTAEEIKASIEFVLTSLQGKKTADLSEVEDARGINLIPNDYGIRNKVIELITRERNSHDRFEFGESSKDKNKGPDYESMSLEELEVDPVAAKVLNQKAFEYLKAHDPEWREIDFGGWPDDEEKVSGSFEMYIQYIPGGEELRQVMEETKRTLLKRPRFIQPPRSLGL
jgi:hypothetical protein